MNDQDKQRPLLWKSWIIQRGAQTVTPMWSRHRQTDRQAGAREAALAGMVKTAICAFSARPPSKLPLYPNTGKSDILLPAFLHQWACLSSYLPPSD